MTYTTHGHHINGTRREAPAPARKARCGGPGMCDVCSRESAAELRAVKAANEVPIPEEVRPNLMQKALDAQASCLTMFDAIEAGDLARAAIAQMDVLEAMRHIGNGLRPYALEALIAKGGL